MDKPYTPNGSMKSFSSEDQCTLETRASVKSYVHTKQETKKDKESQIRFIYPWLFCFKPVADPGEGPGPLLIFRLN